MSHPRPAASLIALAAALMLAAPASAQEVPIVQPGAPGQDSRTISAEEAVRLADTRWIVADVDFLTDMIPHHRQALEMANLVEGRTANEDLAAVAERIRAGQDDEIDFMESWLSERGLPVPAAAMDHAAMGHADMGHGRTDGGPIAMKGMASAEQLAALRAATGTEFDRQFLTLMIAHHEGAIDMVDELFDIAGSAHDPALADFATGVKNDQNKEIETMNVALARLSVDPRARLAAGLFDAETAISGMRLVASLRKPTGFFDPANPGELMLPKPKAEAEDADEPEEPARDDNEANPEDGTSFGSRSPLLSFSQTDMAFSGPLLVAGNYHGFNAYELGVDGVPALKSSVVCPGGQGDVSIVGDLLIMSVEQTRGRIDCGLQGVNEDVSEDRFRGLRIFDISDVTRPRQVGLVQTCRGSHTHSVVSADDETIVVYNSGTARVREEEELEGCIGDVPGDTRTALFSIDVIEIPVADPAAARIVDRPRVFADYETGNIAGLWRGGDHGEGTQTTYTTNQCHDITVFPTKNLAAGACSGNGIILDISDPRAPVRIDDVTDKGFAYWHSATFNNDGTKVLFTDEWGGGVRARCRSQDPRNWGADAIYDIEDGRLTERGLYKIPVTQGDKENCVAHNGSIIPVPGRDIFVQAWYQGGISVIDFTDSANPVEIAFFDRGAVDEEQLVVGGFWSVYWYNGRIYGTEITRGLDVLALEPSAYLTQAEIDAALAADMGDTFNPQQQFPVSWPDDVAAALAHVDQLERAGTLDPAGAETMRTMLGRAAETVRAMGSNAAMAAQLRSAAEGLGEADGTVAQRQRAMLVERLAAIADRIA